MNGILETFFLAMTPLGELRAAIPVALAVYKMPLATAYLVSVIGNLVPVVLLLLFLEPVSVFLRKKSRFFESFFSWLFERTRKKGESQVKKYGYPALALFVAVPLPMTGGWTGCAIAFLFKMPFTKALAAIGGGVALAGAIVAIATKTGIAINKYLGWQTLFVLILLITVGWLIYHKFKS